MDRRFGICAMTLMTAVVSSAPRAADAADYVLSLSGSAHWVNSTGIKRYSAEATLCAALQPDGSLVVTTPTEFQFIHVLLPRGEFVTFKICPATPLVGKKLGNKLVFSPVNGEHPKAFYSAEESSLSKSSERFGEVVGYDGTTCSNAYPEALYLPVEGSTAPWDGTWSRTNRVDMDGDIYRAPESAGGYLDLLLDLRGAAVGDASEQCPQ